MPLNGSEGAKPTGEVWVAGGGEVVAPFQLEGVRQHRVLLWSSDQSLQVIAVVVVI